MSKDILKENGRLLELLDYIGKFLNKKEWEVFLSEFINKNPKYFKFKNQIINEIYFIVLSMCIVAIEFDFMEELKIEDYDEARSRTISSCLTFLKLDNTDKIIRKINEYISLYDKGCRVRRAIHKRTDYSKIQEESLKDVINLSLKYSVDGESVPDPNSGNFNRVQRTVFGYSELEKIIFDCIKNLTSSEISFKKPEKKENNFEIGEIEDLPNFKYHPDPLSTEVIFYEKTHCPVCKKDRDYVYKGPFYSKERVKGLCPWCISDGSAAEKYDGEFCNPTDIDVDNKAFIDELSHKTPGYYGIQQEQWLSHCDDFCAYLGTIDWDKIKELGIEKEIEKDYKKNFPDGVDFKEIKESLKNNGYIECYLFQCIHCKKYRIYTDCG